MSSEPLKNDLRVIVTAGVSDNFRWKVTFLLDRLGADYVVCEDLYATVAMLAERRRHEPVAIVGSLEQLCREQMRFFDICRDRGEVECCCLVRSNSLRSRRQMASAIKAGAFVADNVEQIEGMLEGISGSRKDRKSSDRTVGRAAKEFSSRKDLSADEGILSRSERDALLGAG
jgi:hypothetical protein